MSPGCLMPLICLSASAQHPGLSFLWKSCRSAERRWGWAADSSGSVFPNILNKCSSVWTAAEQASGAPPVHCFQSLQPSQWIPEIMEMREKQTCFCKGGAQETQSPPHPLLCSIYWVHMTAGGRGSHGEPTALWTGQLEENWRVKLPGAQAPPTVTVWIQRPWRG